MRREISSLGVGFESNKCKINGAHARANLVKEMEDLDIRGVGLATRSWSPERSRNCTCTMELVGLSVALDAVAYGMDVGYRAGVIVAVVAGGSALRNLEHGHELPVEECVQHLR